MRCLYEVLEVGQGADASEIKQKYRSLALQWHPGTSMFVQSVQRGKLLLAYS
jgi:DnaJ-class molecular chaperone